MPPESREGGRERERGRERWRERNGDREREMERKRKTERVTGREGERERETERDRENVTCIRANDGESYSSEALCEELALILDDGSAMEFTHTEAGKTLLHLYKERILSPQ